MYPIVARKNFSSAAQILEREGDILHCNSEMLSIHMHETMHKQHSRSLLTI